MEILSSIHHWHKNKRQNTIYAVLLAEVPFCDTCRTTITDLQSDATLKYKFLVERSKLVD